MIRKKASSQKTKRGIKKTANYILKDKGCCLYEASFIHRPNTIKNDLANRLSSEIDDDVNFYNSNRKIGSTQQVRTYHDIVSFHTNDDMNPQKALQIAKELYEKTHNLSNRKYLMAVHNDTDEMHVHIIWSVRDNNGKTYKQKDDYRIIEIECDKLEDKYKLIKPKNRKATSTNKNDIEPLPSTNERMLDVRGIVSNKKKMKDALKPYLDNASSPSDFINQITENGFNVIHNGKSSFSIQLDDQIFKASELNLSYKTLKAKLGEDEEFENTLSKKHQVKKQVEDCFLLSSDKKPDFMNRVNPKSVLSTKFKYERHNDKVEYFYNTYNSKKSFEYYKDPSKVLFNDTSRQSAKAGLQRLLADSNPPSTFTVSGGNHFKKNIWLEFQLMGLEAKGFKLEGYQPKPADLEELKKIQEQYASMNKKVEPKQPEMAIEAPKPVFPIPTQEKPKPLQKAPEKPPVEEVNPVRKQFNDLLSSITPAMLCVAHKALTCKSCFGSNFENAPEQKIEDFRRVNRELPQFKEEFSKEIEERKAFLENQFSFQRRYNNYQQEKRIEEERNKPVQPVEKPIQPEPVKKQNSTEFGNSNSYEEMIRRMEKQEKLKREAQARNEQEKEKKQKSRKTNSYRP
ncbi:MULTISPECIES: relaxase/mobilization nuclease domain-containing protein [Pseudomonas]|uniref:relaxase/mobilization nuclease domain-containing protein n=1 Tax=Pseudomonas TaxID=286 RepID=UPI0009A85E84|nr:MULTISPECIES: relaxase/mobilization nuclease domain-containing protein [Pseudomonas]MBZ3678658.1 relaxase/mobilization nuclease domain-containing protein [Pseudomonas aeruginosa]MBZ3689913.1 relaxase/mobilization nuclease domain-containing protein [Pseudomonas aeruginosa]MCL8301979.1 relaxase/mobilization nuclease domain-containing protein [Pseudomonas mosselii]MCL8342383.1 relaxase/mobilization nuclease domain-containing protein [Pseudomonas mosselii]MDH1534185.1 relaxase/mobilization nucl